MTAMWQALRAQLFIATVGFRCKRVFGLSVVVNRSESSRTR